MATNMSLGTVNTFRWLFILLKHYFLIELQYMEWREYSCHVLKSKCYNMVFHTYTNEKKKGTNAFLLIYDIL